MKPIRVLVVDDQAIVRDGLVTILDLADDIEVVGQASEGSGVPELAAATRPDVVLMDLRMPGVDGVQATARLTQTMPGTRVVVLTTHDDDASITAALGAGALGYLTKDASRAALLAAVRSAAADQAVLGAELGARLLARVAASIPAPADDREPGSRTSPSGIRARFPALTPREAEVLALIARGLPNPRIAAELFVTTSTVKTYVNAIFAKLGVATRAEAVTVVLS